MSLYSKPIREECLERKYSLGLPFNCNYEFAAYSNTWPRRVNELDYSKTQPPKPTEE